MKLARFSGGNHRVGQKQIAGFKFGIESTDFQGSAWDENEVGALPLPSLTGRMLH